MADVAGNHLRHRAYAGLVSRLVALVIDIVIVTLAAAAVLAVGVGGSRVMLGETPGWVRAAVGGVIALLPAGYLSGGWWVSGQTFGNMAIGIVVPDDAGRPLRFPRALLWAVLGLALAPFWLAGLLAVLVDARRRGLLDMVCRTVVLYVPDSKLLEPRRGDDPSSRAGSSEAFQNVCQTLRGLYTRSPGSA